MVWQTTKYSGTIYIWAGTYRFEDCNINFGGDKLQTDNFFSLLMDHMSFSVLINQRLKIDHPNLYLEQNA